MTDYGLEIRRLNNGIAITRAPKPRVLLNSQRRNEYKTKYLNGKYTALEYVKYISSTIGSENKGVVSSTEISQKMK